MGAGRGPGSEYRKRAWWWVQQDCLEVGAARGLGSGCSKRTWQQVLQEGMVVSST